MSPFWVKTIIQVAITAIKRWWNKKDKDKEEQKILDDVNKAVNGRRS